MEGRRQGRELSPQVTKQTLKKNTHLLIIIMISIPGSSLEKKKELYSGAKSETMKILGEKEGRKIEPFTLLLLLWLLFIT